MTVRLTSADATGRNRTGIFGIVLIIIIISDNKGLRQELTSPEQIMYSK